MTTHNRHYNGRDNRSQRRMASLYCAHRPWGYSESGNTPDAPIGALKGLLRLSYCIKLVYRVYQKYTGEVETSLAT